MKKLFLVSLVAIALVCIFTLSVSAKEYNPTNYAELKAAFTEIGSSAEDHVINVSGSYVNGYESVGFPVTSNGTVTINLLDDTYVACRFYVTGATNLVFNLNGHTLKNTYARGGDAGSQFLLNNTDARIIARGGSIEINDVCFWYYKGHIECYDVRIVANEETLWTGGNGGAGDITFINCQVASVGKTFNIGSCSKANTRVFTLIGSTFTNKSGGSITTTVQCPAEGSVIKDCNFVGTFEIDSWCQHFGTSQSDIVIENNTANTFSPVNGMEYYTVKSSTFDKVVLKSDSAGDVHLTLVDCAFKKVEWSGSQGSYAVAYTSVSCESPATMTTYKYNNTIVDEQYSLDNPALGHNMGIVFEYAKGYLAEGTKRDGCSRCDNYTEEATPALFTWKGFSFTETAIGGYHSVSQSFSINKEAIASYNASLQFGTVFASNLAEDELSFDLSEGSGVMFKNLSDCATNYVEAKITGISGSVTVGGLTVEASSIKLVFCLYVIDGEGVYYLDGNETKTTVTGVSYDELSAQK